MNIRKTLFLSAGVSAALFNLTVQAAETVTIATVNNGDMIRMQRLSKTFEQQHPDIKLNWVVLEENVLRQRLTTDIATQGGQFDVLTIGTYETPLWGAKQWLEPVTGLVPDYDLQDIFPSVRQGLSVKDTLYALPFYGESTITYYRTDLFKQAGLSMPEHRPRRSWANSPRSCISPTRAFTACACAARPVGARTSPCSAPWPTHSARAGSMSNGNRN